MGDDTLTIEDAFLNGIINTDVREPYSYSKVFCILGAVLDSKLVYESNGKLKEDPEIKLYADNLERMRFHNLDVLQVEEIYERNRQVLRPRISINGEIVSIYDVRKFLMKFYRRTLYIILKMNPSLKSDYKIFGVE